MNSLMTVEDVRALIRHQSAGSLAIVNDHRITLMDALIEPRMIPVIERQIEKGR